MHEAADDHELQVAHERASKDAFFRTSPHSPIPVVERSRFGGLAYYAIDPAMRLAGLRLAPGAADEPPEVQIATSDGGQRTARRLGTLAFEIHAQPRALAAYGLGGADGSLFVPFLDATSGTETYGAGRYLDLEPEPDGTYVLDFNVAYHPYCAYSPDYSCPLTPTENRLPDRIEAGERLASTADH